MVSKDVFDKYREEVAISLNKLATFVTSFWVSLLERKSINFDSQHECNYSGLSPPPKFLQKKAAETQYQMAKSNSEIESPIGHCSKCRNAGGGINLLL